MTDTPRVPDFRWHPDHGMFLVEGDRAWHVKDEVSYQVATLPADVVKLGDVGAAYDRGFADGCAQGANDLREEVRAVVDEMLEALVSGPERRDVERIAEILDREPGREEPTCPDCAERERFMQRDREQAQRATAGRDQLQARIDEALVEISAWWGTARPGDRVLMAVNSILRGDVPSASPVAKETGEEANG